MIEANRNVILKSLALLMSERGLKLILGFFVHAWLARYLGPIEFGKMTYLIKITTIFFTFALFGFDEFIIKELIHRREDESSILKTTQIIRLRMGLLGWAFLGLFILIAKPYDTFFQVLMMGYGVNIIIQSLNVFELPWVAKIQYRSLFLGNNLSYISASAFRIIGIVTKQKLPFFLSSYLFGELILKFYLLSKYQLKQIWQSTYDVVFAKNLFIKSLPIFICSFLAILDQRISFFFIEEFLNDVSLGNYSIVITLAELIIFVPTAIAGIFYPLMVSHYQSHHQAYKNQCQHLVGRLTWLAIIFGLILYFGSPLFIKILYGDNQYQEANGLLKIYGLCFIPLFYNIARLKWMTLEDRLHQWLKLNIAGLVLNFILQYVFIKFMGTRGAIVGFSVSQFSIILGGLLFKNLREDSLMFIKSFFYPLRFSDLKT